MLPPEKDDGNIEYKRYIMIKINKSIDLSKGYSDCEYKAELFTNNIHLGEKYESIVKHTTNNIHLGEKYESIVKHTTNNIHLGEKYESEAELFTNNIHLGEKYESIVKHTTNNIHLGEKYESDLKNLSNYSSFLNKDKLTEEDIDDFHSKLFNKRLTNNLRFNQLASQMKFRLNEGNGVAIYYLGINDNGSVYNLSNKERTESINNIRELVKFIDCKIDKLIFIDNYVKVIIKNKESKKLEEKNILLLGDTESGKTTFLAYLVKNKLDNKYSKARLHILNHKHELESGKTSSFTCEYTEFNETNLVFIDSPGWDGINRFNSLNNTINMKSSRKRNKLILTFEFDLIIFFDKPGSKWCKKEFYEDYASYSCIPTLSLNLFDDKSYINLINPITQEQILSYINSLFERFKNNSKSSVKIDKDTKLDEITNMLYKMDCIFPNDKNLLLSPTDYKRKLKYVFDKNTLKCNEFDNSDQINITFINSYPHQDLGLILSGYLSSGKLKINQKLYCYMDIKIDGKESEMSKLINPLLVQVKSIYKNGHSINSINSPSTITISIDYCNNFGKNILNVYGDFSKLLRLKDVQVNFLSNFSYKPDLKFKLIWYSYTKDNGSNTLYSNVKHNTDNIPLLAKDKYESKDSSEIFINDNNTIQIMVKNQLINLKKIIEDNSCYYVLQNSKKSKQVFNLNNQKFIYEDIDSHGFGKILTNNFI